MRAIMYALKLLIPALGFLGIASGAGTEMTKRAGSTAQRPVWEAIDTNKHITKISELQAIAKDYFEWVKTQQNADAENDACIVSSFYDTTTMRVYSSTIPRDGDYRTEMRTQGNTNAPVWFAAGGRASPYHAEDACYYDYEKENKQTTGKSFYPGGKMIASYGYLKAARKTSPGPVDNPCGDLKSGKRPSCSSVARSLHVKWKDSQKYNDGACSETWMYNELDGNMYDEHGQVVGQDVFDEATGEIFYSTDTGKRRSLAGRIKKRAATTTVACVKTVSSSIASKATKAAATTPQKQASSSAEATSQDKTTSSSKTLSSATVTSAPAAIKTSSTAGKAKSSAKSKATLKSKAKGQ